VRSNSGKALARRTRGGLTGLRVGLCFHISKISC
jgi:hypothetical protein